MAPRNRKIRHDEETRAKIQASQLINRLQDHVFGKVDLKPTQVQSALGLLKKSVPDISAVQHTGGDGGPVQVSVIRFTNAGNTDPS